MEISSFIDYHEFLESRKFPHLHHFSHDKERHTISIFGRPYNGHVQSYMHWGMLMSITWVYGTWDLVLLDTYSICSLSIAMGMNDMQYHIWLLHMQFLHPCSMPHMTGEYGYLDLWMFLVHEYSLYFCYEFCCLYIIYPECISIMKY